MEPIIDTIIATKTITTITEPATKNKWNMIVFKTKKSKW